VGGCSVRIMEAPMVGFSSRSDMVVYWSVEVNCADIETPQIEAIADWIDV